MSNRASVMVVDDDADVRDTLAETLEERGYVVDAAQDGRQALDLLLAGARPGVILLDLMMPVMDGWAFRAEQRKNVAIAGIPVVVFSAHSTAREAATELAAAAVLEKPVRLDVLMSTLERVLGTQAS